MKSKSVNSEATKFTFFCMSSLKITVFSPVAELISQRFLGFPFALSEKRRKSDDLSFFSTIESIEAR